MARRVDSNNTAAAHRVIERLLEASDSRKSGGLLEKAPRIIYDGVNRDARARMDLRNAFDSL